MWVARVAACNREGIDGGWLLMGSPGEAGGGGRVRFELGQGRFVARSSDWKG